MTVWLAFPALLAAFKMEGSGAAQPIDQARVLQDGRIITVAAETVACGTPSPAADPRFAIALSFECRDPISGVSGAAFLGVAEVPGETTPREYLASVGEDFWPHMTPALRSEQIQTATAEFSGREVELMCIAAGDREGTTAEATCVLSQPRTQVIMHMRSTGVQEAYGVMLMFLTGVSVR